MFLYLPDYFLLNPPAFYFFYFFLLKVANYFDTSLEHNFVLQVDNVNSSFFPLTKWKLFGLLHQFPEQE